MASSCWSIFFTLARSLGSSKQAGQFSFIIGKWEDLAKSRKNSDDSINNADVYQTDQGTEDDHGTKKPKNENVSSTCDDGYCVPCFEIL